MDMNTIFIFAVVLLYIVLAWQFYIGLDKVLPAPKWVNIISGLFWPGFIIMILALIVIIMIAGCILAVVFAGAVAFDIIRRMFSGVPIEIENLPVNKEE